ncbi:MAG TPA: diguanylate cyclase [Pirellulales bacterium]|nr:diguanylate cyclase [Pirellulales bacterium]
MATLSGTLLIIGIALVVIISLAMGVFVGWHLRGQRSVNSDAPSPPAAPPKPQLAASQAASPAKPQTKQAAKPEAKPQAKQDAKPQPKHEAQPEAKPAVAVEPEQVRRLLGQLHELTDQATSGVGTHSSRVEEISDQLRTLCSGEQPLEQFVLDAARQLVQANEKLRAELDSTKGQLQEHARQIESHMAEARTDGLCGVANRRAFDEELSRRFRELNTEGRGFSLILLDVDHFKKFNDTHGHQAGDEVLRTTGKVLSENVRECDIVARYGGEEFAVIVPDASFRQAQATAEQLRAAVAKREIAFEGRMLQVTASLGVAEAAPQQDPAALISGADQALYAAKANGRNRAYFFNGQSCEFIDPEWFAENRDILEQVEQQIDEEIRTGKPVDRRNQPRRPFPTNQFIAPYAEGQMPTREMFRQVPCHDISAGGFSFLSPDPPDFEQFVVALGVPPNVTYLTAKVVHTTVTDSGPVPMFLVGCRFTGRINLDAEGGESVAATASASA